MKYLLQFQNDPVKIIIQNEKELLNSGLHIMDWANCMHGYEVALYPLQESNIVNTLRRRPKGFVETIYNSNWDIAELSVYPEEDNSELFNELSEKVKSLQKRLDQQEQARGNWPN